MNIPVKTRYTKIPNTVSRDKKLTMNERAVLVYVLSMPENYIISTPTVAAGFTESRDTVRRTLQGLCEHGYLTQDMEKRANGKFAESTFQINREKVVPGSYLIGFKKYDSCGNLIEL